MHYMLALKIYCTYFKVFLLMEWFLIISNICVCRIAERSSKNLNYNWATHDPIPVSGGLAQDTSLGWSFLHPPFVDSVLWRPLGTEVCQLWTVFVSGISSLSLISLKWGESLALIGSKYIDVEIEHLV